MITATYYWEQWRPNTETLKWREQKIINNVEQATHRFLYSYDYFWGGLI